MNDAIVSVVNITRQYAGTLALDAVDFDIMPGEIVGLIGENGAGKSTLMRIVSGIEQPSSGQIQVRGRPVQFTSPQAAQAHGIAMIPQEVLLIDELTVVENMFLGHELSTAFGGLSRAQMRSQAQRILDELGCHEVQPDQAASTLAKGAQQMVAIARRVMQGGSVFIMDEPTASLTGEQTQALFGMMRRLKSEGKSSVFISHRLEEMLDICDRIVVLRDGQRVGNYTCDATLSKDRLVSAMIGTTVANEFSRTISNTGELILELKALELSTFQGRRTPPITLSSHAGELIGITGLAGVGKTELAHVLAGLRAPLAGEMHLKGKPLTLKSPVSALRHRIGLVSEDRRAEGLVLNLTSLANMTLTSLRKLARLGRIDRAAEQSLGESMQKKLNMKAEYLQREANLLSGGNQQKVVIIRQLCADTELLLLDEPTKGIDIGAKAEVYRLIGDLAADNKAAILFSSEPQEVLGVCDKIYVLTPTEFHGPYLRGELDYAALMALEFGTTNTVPEEVALP
ncbi:sugar ABC transporter ATP-binding protein [Granulosicoccus antarcticus]|uniref:Ribose import ATP-binding protein RbsA n=1 Tax=Granulosicoccus antarcticus IMCC3135 TaxID=1192854 RepID=A0A2Z2P556_9GAMM|nr:sugar ABC transporter ATP-binding protein [Granulosicoccus antarcticus]ASJ75817.1 Ribose import ATP-binding protein RbsA [Granulosicoccus antarcticus IMCC3135]